MSPAAWRSFEKTEDQVQIDSLLSEKIKDKYLKKIKMSVTHSALSGEILKNPVVSTKSGHVFEKSLIEKHILNTGQCPHTGSDLFQSDLLALKVAEAVRPNALVENCVPNILTLLQTE
jgi:hypothetical protein